MRWCTRCVSAKDVRARNSSILTDITGRDSWTAGQYTASLFLWEQQNGLGSLTQAYYGGDFSTKIT